MQALSARRARAVALGYYKMKHLVPVWTPRPFKEDLKSMAAGKILHAQRAAEIGETSHSLQQVASKCFVVGPFSHDELLSDLKVTTGANTSKHRISKRQLQWASGRAATSSSSPSSAVCSQQGMKVRRTDAWADISENSDYDVNVDCAGSGENKNTQELNPGAEVFVPSSPSPASTAPSTTVGCDVPLRGAEGADPQILPSIGSQLDYMLQILCVRVSRSPGH